MADDLALRIRDYARGPGRASIAVSSAWLARELDADPRTIAAALRPYGVKPGEVERGVRGYLVVDLAGLAIGGGSGPAVSDPPGPAQPDGVPAGYETAGTPSANHWSSGMTDAQIAATIAAGSVEIPLSELSAVDRLSAGAGHDMAPALRAAGLL